VLALELCGDPFEIDLIQRDDQPRIVDDEAVRRGSGRERHLSRAGPRERHRTEQADRQDGQ
jgi:hypothetical protein